jgi:hypothetical protein
MIKLAEYLKLYYIKQIVSGPCMNYYSPVIRSDGVILQYSMLQNLCNNHTGITILLLVVEAICSCPSILPINIHMEVRLNRCQMLIYGTALQKSQYSGPTRTAVHFREFPFTFYVIFFKLYLKIWTQNVTLFINFIQLLQANMWKILNIWKRVILSQSLLSHTFCLQHYHLHFNITLFGITVCDS